MLIRKRRSVVTFSSLCDKQISAYDRRPQHLFEPSERMRSLHHTELRLLSAACQYLRRSRRPAVGFWLRQSATIGFPSGKQTEAGTGN